ncbi:hypothetical protein CYY_008569 [Polysphondylium violaceum]|uniref:Ankyrin repeat-containing protein n=1 Tax=Polysphondylium violaceum TaxID=133409 RepID=A0A8J4PUZ1_9MYCE|nr:hypothetical protein CYY_008569 [Polysphondylium violaceum]
MSESPNLGGYSSSSSPPHHHSIITSVSTNGGPTHVNSSTTTTTAVGGSINTTVVGGTITTASAASSNTTPSSPSINRNVQHHHNNTTTTTSNSSNTLQVPPPASLQSGGSSTNLTSIPTPSGIQLSAATTNTGNTQNEYLKAMENKKALKKILKVSKHWTDSMKVYCQNSHSFSEELLKQSEQIAPNKKDSNLNIALVSFGHTLKAVNSVHDQLMNEVQDVFCTPLHNFVDYDFAEVVESNKRVSKSKEDYDQSLGKISSSIKKSKTGIEETKLFLYEQELEKLKEVLETSNKDLDVKLQELSHKNETKYLKSLFLFINSQYHFFNRASKLFGNLKPKLDDIERYLEEIQPPKVVEGHLMKKSKQVMGGWNKCWYVLKDGMLYCYKGKKEFHPENALNILLCSVRLPQTMMMVPSPQQQQPNLSSSSSLSLKDQMGGVSNSGSSTSSVSTSSSSSSTTNPTKEQVQEYRFEILHPRKKQPIVLQAESEEERDRWVTAIQDAISNSLNCQRLEKSTSTTLGGGGASMIKIGAGGTGSGSNANANQIQTDEVNQQVLRILHKVAGNTMCADCGCPDPDWAAINLGILICKVCSGVHRSLGTHISKVRSLTLDKWSPENILFMKEVGNTKFNLLFEHHIAPDQIKPNDKSDRMAKEQWIRAKYKTKDFIIKSTLPPEELSKMLYEMIQTGQRDIIRYIKLISQGAEINYFGEDGRTCLHQSILKSDDVLIPELLLQNRADITLVDPRGWTPMHYAAFFNRPRCAQLLMKRGFESVRLKCRDHLSRLAIDLALLNHSKECEKILLGEELDTGLNMDNIENNTIPVYEPTTPISTDFPIVHQEILSDDDEDLVDQSNANAENDTEVGVANSWSENESRSSFSAPDQDTIVINTLNSSNNNNSTTTSSNNNMTLQNSNNSINSNSNSNINSLVIPPSGLESNSSSSSSLTESMSKENSKENLKDAKDADYKSSRPKSKRRPSILGRGRNTLKMMKNKLSSSGKNHQVPVNSQDIDDESDSDTEDIDDDTKSTTTTTTTTDSSGIKRNNSSTNVVVNHNNSSNNLNASFNSNSSHTNDQQQQQQHVVDSPTSASAEQDHHHQQDNEDPNNKSPSKSTNTASSPTPFKMFLKKLKISKKKGDKGSTNKGGSDPNTNIVTEGDEDVADNASVITGDDVSETESSSSSNAHNIKKDKKKHSSASKEKRSNTNDDQNVIQNVEEPSKITI